MLASNVCTREAKLLIHLGQYMSELTKNLVYALSSLLAVIAEIHLGLHPC